MEAVLDNLGRYASGVLSTVTLTVASWAGAFVLGVVVAAFRVGPVGPLRAAAATYVELVRNCPLAVLFALFFFGLPDAGLTLPTYTTAVVVLSLYTGTYVAETVRSGINAVAAGQAEAARSLGLSFTQVLAGVVLPQALRTVVAPLGSLFIALIRNSSIALTIGVVELTGTASQIGNRTADYTAAFLAATTAYLLLTLPSGIAVDALERRVAVKR
ncbi:MAG TPA: amino acid ABC transporter permease [Acidimicrobiales bacterium]|nr:amino acid ABC transporter permease [Acidimicrobiales bacterium]